MNSFYLDSTPPEEKDLIIRLPDDLYKLCRGTTSSYNVIQARLFGLTYPDYLRMCRDKYNAVLIGKQGYSSAQWDRDEHKDDALRLVKELNNRWAVWWRRAKKEKLI